MDLRQQDLDREVYLSARGTLAVKRMVTRHAARALALLEAEHGGRVRETVLGRALAARAQLDGSQRTEVPAVQGEGCMLRGRQGHFVGAWYATAEVER
jgi:hypothetical protein